MSIKVNGNWVSLHVRADKLLALQSPTLKAEDLTFLNSLSSRKIVWGTEYQVKRMDNIEAQFKNPTAKQQ